MHTYAASRSMTLSRYRHCKGMSLIEISIVLIIIGLLTAGVMLGQSLIVSSTLKDVVADMDYYSSAVRGFQEKYSALPGDMSTATTTWGALNADNNICKTMTSTNVTTCNGDGNGRIDAAGEEFLVWKHLANANMIKGSYTGTGGADLNNPVPSVSNIPPTKFPNTYVSIGYRDLNPGGIYFNGTYGNFFVIGAIGTTAGVTEANYPTLMPEQAQEMDNKMDNGIPGTGIVRSFNNTRNPSCANGGGTAYLLTGTDPFCSIIYIPGF